MTETVIRRQRPKRRYPSALPLNLLLTRCVTATTQNSRPAYSAVRFSEQVPRCGAERTTATGRKTLRTGKLALTGTLGPTPGGTYPSTLELHCLFSKERSYTKVVETTSHGLFDQLLFIPTFFDGTAHVPSIRFRLILVSTRSAFVPASEPLALHTEQLRVAST